MQFFASPGFSTTVMYKSQVSETLNVAVTTETSSEYEIAAVAEEIKSELHQIPSLSDVYPVFNNENIQTTTSHTLNTFLMMISLKLKNRLKFVSLISGMISSIIIDKTSMLQVALADLINEMRLIEHLHEYGVTCTYTESRRFKTYAAAANKELVKLEATNGLIQAACDNFDANLSTQNGLKQ